MTAQAAPSDKATEHFSSGVRSVPDTSAMSPEKPETSPVSSRRPVPERISVPAPETSFGSVPAAVSASVALDATATGPVPARTSTPPVKTAFADRSFINPSPVFTKDAETSFSAQVREKSRQQPDATSTTVCDWVSDVSAAPEIEDMSPAAGVPSTTMRGMPSCVA